MGSKGCDILGADACLQLCMACESQSHALGKRQSAQHESRGSSGAASVQETLDGDGLSGLEEALLVATVAAGGV